MEYTLLYEEYVLLKDSAVDVDGNLNFYAENVIITNKNIICEYYFKENDEFDNRINKLKYSGIQVFKPTYKDEYDDDDDDDDGLACLVLPLQKVKVYQGKPQIIWSEDENDIDIFFYDFNITLTIDTPWNKEKAKEKRKLWVNTLKTAVLSIYEETSTVQSGIKRFCPSCGNEINKGYEYCPKCGKKIDNSIYITKEEQTELLICLKKLFQAGFLNNEEFCEKEKIIMSCGR
ncbi:MAG: zinc ribbon domain-containing protein [Lachnospiraceae bacterium]|nr:zinc ribbon domain-containing protein [Lachnospiraceae bacterium]